MSKWNISARFSFFELELLTELKPSLPNWNYIFIFFWSVIVRPRYSSSLRETCSDFYFLCFFKTDHHHHPSHIHKSHVPCKKTWEGSSTKFAAWHFQRSSSSGFFLYHRNRVQNRHGWMLLNPSLVCSGSEATSFKCGEDTCGPDE